MKLMRKIAVSLVLWATAASTLLASTPHFVCQCASPSDKIDVSIKSSCCAATSESGCCGDSASPSKKSCCGQHEDAQPTTTAENSKPTADDGPTLSNAPCQKRIVKAVDQVMVRHIGQADEVLQIQLAMPTLAYEPSLQASLQLSRDVRQFVSPLPPIDLVISLQHFVI